ncbi:MAG: hypothetical protein WDZ69_01950 [Candidatus Pacearchaeota archaeon]
MAYKKYIKRGGKIYGPYVYHSRRVDGKVVSEYRGSGEKLSYKKISLAVLGVFALLALVYVFSQIDTDNIGTGRAVLNLDADSFEGFNENSLVLSLDEDEFIPASSTVVFENNGNTIFEGELREIVSGEAVNGSFYVSGSSISGTGEGYGISSVDVNSEVSFELIVEVERPDDESQGGSGQGDSSSGGEGQSDSEDETNSTNLNDSEDTNELDNETSETTDEAEDEVIDEGGETTDGEDTENSEESGETDEEIIEEENGETTDETDEGNTEDSSDGDDTVETTDDGNEDSSDDSITASGVGDGNGNGNLVALGITMRNNDSDEEILISKILNAFRNIFSEPELTGRAIGSGEGMVVQGSVSLEEDFIYEIEEGIIVDARVAPGSVSSGSESLSDDEVNVEVEGNRVVVTTDYSGEESSGTELELDVSGLDLEVEEGNLRISVSYSDEEIISYRTSVRGAPEVGRGDDEEEDEVILVDPIDSDLNETNETSDDDDLNQTNETDGEVINFSSNLTEEEIQTLIEHFGENYSVELENSKEEVNRSWERVVIYGLGSHSVEFAYDRELSENVREGFEERDRINWLKDIVKSLS